MAFPVIRSFAGSNSGANVTTTTPDVNGLSPAPQEGDLIVIGIVKDGTGSFTWPAGWDNLAGGVFEATNQQGFCSVRKRIYAAGDSNPAITHASEGTAHHIYCFKKGTWHGIAAGIEAATMATGDSTNPNPPSLDPSGWGTEDTTWLAFAFNDGNVAITAGPSGYTSFQNDRWANSNGVGVASAREEDTQLSVENPGAFTMNTEQWGAATIAVRPCQQVVGANISGTSINAPTAKYVVVGPTKASGVTLFSPTVAFAGQSVTAGTIAAGTTLGAPTAAYRVVSGTIASGSALFAPTVAPGPVTVVGGTVAGTILSVPSAAYRIAAAFLAATVLSAPTVSPGPVTVVGATIAATTIGQPSAAHRIVLSNKLRAHYSLEEASGTRADDKGFIPLTEFGGTIANASGVVGNAIHYVASNSRGLRAPNSGAFQQGSFDYGVCCWVKLSSLPASAMYVYAKDDATNREFGLLRDNVGNVWQAFMQFTDNSTLAVSDITSLSTGIYYFVCFWYDPVAETLNIQVNDGTVFSTSTAGKTPKQATSIFILGARRSNSPTSYFDGDVDQWGYYKPSPTSAQRTWLYNGGAGRAFSDVEEYLGAVVVSTVLNAPAAAYRVVAASISGTVVSAPTVRYAATAATISGTQLFAPDVSQGGGAQSVTGGTIASGNTLTAPSTAYRVVGGTVASTALGPPSTAYRVVGGTRSSALQLFAPTVSPGAVTVTGGTIAATTLGVPTVAYRIAGASISGTTLAAPTVTTGALTITAGTRASQLTLGPPLVAYRVVGGTITSGSALFAPRAAYRIFGPTKGSGLALFAPSVRHVVTSAFISGTVLSPPTVTASGAVSGGHVSSTLALYAPSLRLTVTAGTRASALQLFAPSTTYRVTLGTIQSGNQRFAPTVAVGAVNISLPAIPSGNQRFAPNLAYRIAGQTIASGSALFAPTVAAGAAQLVAGHVSSTLLFPPGVVGGIVVGHLEQTDVVALAQARTVTGVGQIREARCRGNLRTIEEALG